LAKEAEEALKSQQLYAAFMQQGVAKFQGKNYADAVKSLKIASDINTKDTTAPLYGAIGAQQVRDNETAKELLEKYMANGGKDAVVYGSLVQLYRNDKQIDKALAALEKGMAIDPTNKDLVNERINIMLTSNRMDEAVADLKKQVDKDPKNPQNLVLLGQIYDNSAAKLDDEIRKMEGENKKSGNPAKKLADAKGLLDTYNGEVTRLSAALKKQPKNADLTRQLNDVKKRAADQKTTIAQLETAAKEAAANSGATAGNEQKLADSKKKFDSDRTMAIDYYKKAVAVDPNNYDANFGMGVTYFNEAVRMKSAVDAMDMAEYNKRGKEVDGQVCGKFKQALPYFQKAKAAKDDQEVTQNLENLQNILKQYEERKVVCVEPTN
jgi:Tfp pilus assembly protein PilF